MKRTRPLKVAPAGHPPAGADNWCELNLFYGKRGYSIVQTTKSGRNAELAELTAQVLEQLLQERLALDEAASDTEDFQL